MSSFPLGTRVLAKHKQLWRVAIVVEPQSNIDPNQVAIKFVGKTAQIVIPAKNVKLAPRPNDAIDLTKDISELKPNSSVQNQRTTSLPAPISDPYSQESHKPSTASSSPERSKNAPFPPPPFSDQDRDSLHVHLYNSSIPPQCTAKNNKQSSRDWLLAQHSKQPDRNLVAAQSKILLHSAQRQPQVVQDPSFPSAHYPPHPHGNSKSLHRNRFPELSSGEELGPSSQTACEENFDRTANKANAPSFQFTPIRADTKSAQALSSSAPMDHSSREQLPLRPVRSDSGASLRGSPLTVPLRSVLRTRNPERHPLRSIDEHVCSPRTLIAQDLPRIPRHPQSSFDDDVPIPRNSTPRSLLNNAVMQDATDARGTTRLYSISKRPRLRYDQLTGNEMPPALQTESKMGQLSWRLAKRERQHRGHLVDNCHKSFIAASLPYQCQLEQENGRVRIASNFASSEAFGTSSGEASDIETKVLEETLAELSAKLGDIVVNKDDTLLPHIRSRTSSLSVRVGGRRKSHPKKWSRPHDDDCDVVRASSKVFPSEPDFESSSVEGKLTALRDEPPECGVGEHETLKTCPMPRLYGCSCPNKLEEHMPFSNDRYSIQCCLCALWSHMRCIGFEAAEIKALRAGNAKGLEKYICAPCVEEHLELGLVTRGLHSPLSDEAFRAGKKWASSVNTVSAIMLGHSTIATDTMLHLGPVDTIGGNRSAWIREPLAKDEISARRNNFEELRAGFTNASVGSRERVLFDEHLGGQRYHPGDFG